MKLNPLASNTRRATFLTEIGIGVQWMRRTVPPCEEADAQLTEADIIPPSLTAQTAAPAQIAPERIAQPQAIAPSPFADTQIPTLTPVATPAPIPTADAAIATLDLRQLKAAVARCTACPLSEKRSQTVFGNGDEKAQWLFIGPGPGRTEDVVGEPFGGASGKLLDNMLLAIDQRRGQNTYLTNLVKCRPVDANGDDRAPTPQEINACRPFLERQIALIQPTLIVALGKSAAVALREQDSDQNSPAARAPWRGAVHRFAPQAFDAASTQPTSAPAKRIALVVTADPALLLRQPADKAQAWADLCLARKTHANPD